MWEKKLYKLQYIYMNKNNQKKIDTAYSKEFSNFKHKIQYKKNVYLRNQTKLYM